MKLVGISGAQGAGKTTLLNALRDKGWLVDDFKVSRAVQAQLGWERLDNVMESPEKMMTFQNAVFDQKLKNDRALGEEGGGRTLDPQGNIILTERTFADIDAYTTQWTYRFVDQGRMSLTDAFAFLGPFHRNCLQAQNKCYAGTMMLPFMPHVVWEEDQNRAARADVDKVFEHIERYMEAVDFLRHPKLTIRGKTVDDRVAETESFLTRL